MALGLDPTGVDVHVRVHLDHRPGMGTTASMSVFAIYLHNPGQFLDEPTKALPLEAGFDEDAARAVGTAMLRASDRELCTIQREDPDGTAERIVAVFNRDGQPVTY